MATPVQTIVIGAGLSGLTAAYYLRQAGHTVQVLEASAQPGGMIQSHWEAGFLFETGPHTFPSSATELRQLCEALNLTPRAALSAQNRFLYLNQKLAALPSSPSAAITSPALSLAGKLRLLAEPFHPQIKADDISVADFVRYRLGPEVADNLVDPFISGIYAGNMEALSLPAVFPKLWEWEQEGGGILRGALRQRKKSKNAPRKKRSPMQLLSFESGMATLIQSLTQALPENTIRLQTAVECVNAEVQGFSVILQTGDVLQAQNLVLAVPAYVAARLLASVAPSASEALQAIPYNGLSVAHAGFRKADIPHDLDGFGCLIPRREKLPLLGIIWASSLFPERAPEGHVLLSNFIGGAHHPEISAWEPERIEALVLENLAEVFKSAQPLKPYWSRVVRYQQAIPQYTMGHRQRIQAIEQALRKHSRLAICGNYLHGIALNGCVISGLQAAQKLQPGLVAP